MGILNNFLSAFSSAIGSVFGSISEFLKNNKLSGLEKERAKHREELKVAEGEFLKHKISEETYKKVVCEKNMRLIVLDTEIEVAKIEGRLKKYEDDINKLKPQRRALIRGLFGKKDILLREIWAAKNSYFKRKIDKDTYLKITEEKEKEFISVEADINRVYRDEAKDVMKETERQISMSEMQQLEMKADSMAQDIMAQLPSNSGQAQGKIDSYSRQEEGGNSESKKPRRERRMERRGN